ncbi:hypothetical protein RvY_05453 [Ramazzottius varieornatus]|uniref:Protein artemis n=1 Tax=Ramazzottius varieornatus TaxID=947166 RepID=A0A1D1V1R7_RAMVA|nr:hypothetical protein RvY_05453 [Ramazzottius varieornatus]
MMSSFNGLILEYPLVSVDNFSGKSLQSTTYFLSHAHTDHMQGLTSKAFANRLKNGHNCRVFSSECTRNILRDGGDVFGVADVVVKRLEVLPCDAAEVIEVVNHDGEVEYSLTVTTLQAGHCPGSVMFVFDGPNGRVLYTGDFRLYPGQSANLVGLPACVKTVYLDTTFCFAGANKFPRREEAIKSLCAIVKQWTMKNPAAPVFVNTKTRLGYEAVFVELERTLRQKIHVSERRHSMYKSMLELYDILTLDEAESNIHACDKCSVVLQAESALWIKLCAFSFTLKHTNGRTTLKHPKFSHSYRVCFSMHSSFSEIAELVQHVKPRRIVPIAFPPGSDVLQILNLLPKVVPKESVRERTRPEQRLFEKNVNRIAASEDPCIGAASTSTDDLVFEDEIELPKPKRLKFRSF